MNTLRTSIVTGLALGALALGGCGFTPLYAEQGIASNLAAIDVTAPDGRAGFLIRQHLDDAFAKRRGAPAAYSMSLLLSEQRSPRGVRIDNVEGEAGFLRGSLRALVRERKMRGIGSGPAFELIARSDNRLTLLDPATGERLDLESFGPTNAAVYRRWLQDSPAVPSPTAPVSRAAP